MPKLIQMQCVVCHRPASVNTNDPALYQSKIIRENFVCALCSPNVHKVKVVLTCTVCHQPFQTKILLVHKDKYTKDWTCPVCSSAGEPKRNVPKGTSVAVGAFGANMSTVYVHTLK
jgi:DNA-directed RNA polymerase subunit RPC12/RpoP